jgi:capsular polysaccharide biosynthesis protein
MMTKEINFSILLKVLKTAWWKILIITIAVAIAAFSILHFIAPKRYASTVEFYILNTSATSEYTTTALISAAEYLANDYIKIIKGDTMTKTIIEYVEEDLDGRVKLSPAQVRDMITSGTSELSSTFTITITAVEDKELAYSIAKCIHEKAPEIIKSIARPSYSSNMYKKVANTGASDDDFVKLTEEHLECVKVLRTPSFPTAHVAPNVSSGTAIAALLAAVLSYVLFLILKLTDTTVRSEESAKDLINETIIGDIPSWTENTDKEEQS